MFSPLRSSKICTFLASALLAIFLFASSVFAADKVYFKDGSVLEGTITREDTSFIYLKFLQGGIQIERLFMRDQILKIERDAQPAQPTPPKSDPAPASDKPADQPADKQTDTSPSPTPPPVATSDKNKADKTPGSLRGKPTKVAILNFGPPSSWQGEVESTVGLEISAEAFRHVVPMLEKDGVEVVVIRVNSGGGLGLEVGKFHEIFNKIYKPKFRTVAWIESAISAAAMSPWVLEEMYMMPEGNIGACTGWSGDLIATKGFQLEMMIIQMEVASRDGKRSPFIMKAMQVLDAPLSASIDPKTGEVTWFQSLDGDYILNTPDKILTLNASDAVKFNFAKGIAGSKEELAKAMGIEEVEWAGKEASDFIDKNMHDCDRSEKEFNITYGKFSTAYSLAASTQDPKDRAAQVGIARRYLADLRRLNSFNPNFALMRGLDDDWIQERERELKKMLAK